MGSRRAGAGDFHADRDQTAGIHGAVPKGDRVEILPPELGVSGGLPLEQRPSLLQAVEGIEQGVYAGIIVAYLSRLGRNLKEQLRTYDRVHAAGGRIIVAQEGIDGRTRGGRLQRNILAAIHEDEREAHVERFDNLRRWATEAGIWQARQTPTGYRKDPDARQLVPDERAGDVRRAFRDAAAGTPIVRVAERIRMTPSGVRALLKNRVYLGELQVGKYVNRQAHEPIVTVDGFEAAQSSRPRPSRSGAPPALLAGLVRCEACGHVMSRAKTEAVVYVCRGSSSAGRCPAPAAVTARLLDRHVTEIALHRVATVGVRMAESSQRIAAAREQVNLARAELAAYVSAVSAADIGAEAFSAGARQRHDAVDDAEADLRVLLAQRPAAQLLEDGLEAWVREDVHGQNLLLRGLVDVVIVRRGGGRGSRTPLADRVRVLAFGSGVELPRKNGGDPIGVVRLEFPAFDDDRVLRVPGSEDGLEAS